MNFFYLDDKIDPADPLENIFPHFTHIVERICTPQWNLAPGHYSPHNLILVYDGAAVFGCNGQEYHAVKGDLLYFRAGELRWGNTFPNQLMKCYAVDFLYTCPRLRGERWELEEGTLPLATRQSIADPYVYKQLLSLFDELTTTWTAGQPNRIMSCRATFIAIIRLLLIWKNGNGANFGQVHKVDRVIRYMTERYSEILTLHTLSEIAQISPSYLGAIFKRITGKSPIDYLIEIRIQKAKEMLQDGDRVSEVALKVGFNDLFYFSKCFKEREGLAPSQYVKNFCSQQSIE